MATLRNRLGLRKSDPTPQSSRSHRVRFGAPLARPAQDDQLLLEEEILRHHRSHTTRAIELGGHDGQVQQGEQEVPHVRVSVGQTWGAEQRYRILDSAREFPIRDAQVGIPKAGLHAFRHSRVTQLRKAGTPQDLQ